MIIKLFKWINKGYWQFLLGIIVGSQFIAICIIKSANASSYVYSCEYPDRQTSHTALACNIYHEARGEVKADKLGVGFTSLNRFKSERFKGTLVDIIYKPYAFSWTNDGKSDKVYDLNAWIESLSLAAYLLRISPAEYELLDVTEGALFYHRYDILDKVKWADSKYLVGRIGDHMYYWNDRKA